MWQKFLEVLMSAVAFVSTPFITPQIPTVVEQQPAGESEIQAVPDANDIEKDDLIESNQDESKEDVQSVAPVEMVKATDPYCAQYAFRYSDDKYKSESERSKDEKRKCEKKSNGEEGNSVTSLSSEYNCNAVEKKAKKEFEAWKVKYTEYKNRCPAGAETSSGNSITSLSGGIEVRKEEITSKTSESCFTIDKLVKYADDIYYRSAFVLNGMCSKDATTFRWYLDGILIGTSPKMDISWNQKFKGFAGFKVGVAYEIKLTTYSSDGVSTSVSKKISFREMPGVNPCITPNSVETKELELNKEIDFDASCTKHTDENPVVQYNWIFRDGKDGESKSGKKVSHSFAKGATTTTSYQCGGINQALEVELQLVTKSGSTNNAHYYFCIK